MAFCTCASAQVQKDSVTIHFQQSSAQLDKTLGENGRILDDIKEKLQLNKDDSVYYRLEKVLVVGGASPEGSIRVNRRLSEERAEALFDYLSQYGTFPDSLKQTLFIGRDWKGLYRLADADLNLPYRDETLALLRSIQADADKGTDGTARLKAFRGGKPYRYMYRNYFAKLRYSSMYLSYLPVTLPPFSEHTSLKEDFGMEVPALVAPAFTVLQPEVEEKAPLYWSVRTNLLYDALLVPNVGVEFYLGRNLSVGGNWMYAWWKNGSTHKYWRIYGGDINLRWWFGRKAHEKPLTGHHIGIYGQAVTYDFCDGDRGYMGGEPGGNIWDRASFAGGIEYGYSHPIARRLNLDFTVGVGYLGGQYHEYVPEDGCYVWQTTKNRKWFGPTKAEVSLVWLLGRGNYNKEKGGRK